MLSLRSLGRARVQTKVEYRAAWAGSDLVVEIGLAADAELLEVQVVGRAVPRPTVWAGPPVSVEDGRAVVRIPASALSAWSLEAAVPPPPDTPAPLLFADVVFSMAAPDSEPTAVHRMSGFASVEARLVPHRVGDLVITPYVDAKGGLSIAVGDRTPTRFGSASVTRFRRSADGWQVSGTVDAQSLMLEGGSVELVGRRTDEVIPLLTTLTPVPDHDRTHGGVRRYTFHAQLASRDVLGRFGVPELMDLRLAARARGFDDLVRIAIRRVAPSARLSMPASVFSDGTHGAEVRAYRTFKARALALEVRPLDPRVAEIARRPGRAARTLRRGLERPVWVVGERPETAQDTGLAIFEYLRDRHPEIDSRYVITADSPDRDKVRGPGVVEFGSVAHLESVLAAERILSSHHPDYLLPLRGPAFVRAVTARRIFLQHGVLGTKNLTSTYGYEAPGFTAEAFLTSSERERQIVVEELGWPEDRVIVTGLSRHDRLFGEHPPPGNRLLIMPTWRDWLRTREQVEASIFLRRWRELLESPEFAAYLERHDLVADLYLHANMQAFGSLFEFANVNIVRHGEVTIQDLMLRSRVMLTDYTSAAIDFSFLERPVIYYHFDRASFIGPKGSHFDLDEELPGQIVITAAEALTALESVADAGFVPSAAVRARAAALTTSRDGQARERIVQAAHDSPRARRTPAWARDLKQTSSRTLRRAQRQSTYVKVRSRVRTPLNEAVYGLARRMPRSSDIVLESNLGRDTGDSPGAIAAELARRGYSSSMVWVLAPGVAAPAGIRAVPRLSLAHLWTQGRARVWVANQNQPSWMRRPEATTYVQTWHGTPLKRMLHDLEVVVGRDEGYVERVDRMISEWSYLISPSRWASERFRSAFAYDGPIIEVGYPRNDVLADDRVEQRAAAVRKRLGLARSKKVLVYAPTFRDDQRVGGRFLFQIPIDLARLVDQVGDAYEIVVRLHPVVRGKVKLPAGVHNGSLGVAMEDLLAAADVLVTDYSSVMFDFAVRGRPMVFFVPDLADYRDNLRGFYFDFEAEAPGPLIATTEELVELLRSPAAFDEFAGRVLDFRRRFSPMDDGAAASRVVDRLLDDGVLPAP